MKIYLRKVYDIVSWDFIEEMLIGFGFFEMFRIWILECVCFFSFIISCNRELYGYFKGKRGIR